MHKGLISRYPLAGGRDIEARMAGKETLHEYHERVARKLAYMGAHVGKPKHARTTQRGRVAWVPTRPFNVGRDQNKRINITKFLEGKKNDPGRLIKPISLANLFETSYALTPSNGWRTKA